MKILDAGHKYTLDCIDGRGVQTLTFVKRVGPKFPFNVDQYPGTNVQEVLRALIDRTDYLDRQAPCAETKTAAELLRGALLLFELRAARRHGRHLDIHSASDLVSAQTCGVCGHVGCGGHDGELQWTK